MRKKLDTRFPAARIKKIMQTDEDVGKIALAVPLLVSKALELFLQDLCDRTYEITVKRGAKTMNSLHLKQCVHTFNMFDFLKDTVSKVPELGGSDATGEDRSATKRKKVDDEETDSDEELKLAKTYNTGGHSGGSVKGRGRGRGRGRPRGSRNQEKVKYEDCSDNNDQSPRAVHDEGQKENLAGDGNSEAAVRNFDLNVDLNENEDSTKPPAHVRADPYPEAGSAPEEDKHEEYPGWSVADMEKMAQLATLNRTTSDEDEDYDEEEG